MTPDQFLRRCPTLWHVGPIGAWEGIRLRGFCTAEQLVRAADLDEVARSRLLSEPRPESVRLTVDGDTVVLRDQGPLFARKDLTSILGDGLAVSDWVQMLNGRVYLFTDKAKMRALLDKYVSQDGAQEVITFSPSRVLDVYRSRIELSAQNAGAISRTSGTQKHRDTFVSVGLFPDKRPAEITIVDGMDDLSAVAFVERRHADGRKETLPR